MKTGKIFAAPRKCGRKVTALALLVALVVVGSLSFPVLEALGAAPLGTWFQDSWVGGASTTAPFPAYPGNQTGWTKFYSKGAGITAGANLTLAPTATSITQTTDFDFGAGNLANTVVSGSGTAAEVRLAQEPWLKGWNYRRQIVIDNSLNTEALTKFQVLVIMDTAAEIAAGQMRTDCGDVRFTASDGRTIIPHWLESGCNTTTTQFWVKAPSIPAKSTTNIFIYYGNAMATSTSDGVATFAFFDDFEDGDILDWTHFHGAGNRGSLIGVGTGKHGLYGLQITGVHRGSWTTAWADAYQKLALPPGPKIIEFYHKSPGGAWPHANSFLFNDVVLFGPTHTNNVFLPVTQHFTAIAPNKIAFRASRHAYTFGFSGLFDDVRIRKHASPEPTTSLGIETILTYHLSGTFISSAIDTGGNLSFDTLDFTISEPPNTDLKFQLRTADTKADLATAIWHGPTGTTDYYIATGAAINPVHDGHRWIQYKALFSTTDTTVSPTLSDITINYQFYPASASLISSPFNTVDSQTGLVDIRWTETLPAGTQVRFQLRTALDLAGVPGAWTSWMGPDGTFDTFFTDHTGLTDVIPLVLSDGIADQWIQYKVWLKTLDGSVTPTLSAITLEHKDMRIPASPVNVRVTNLDSASAFDGAVAVHSTDLDGDGDQDILGAAFHADEIAWWRNDGGGAFTKFIIDSTFDGAEDVHSADLDGDGDIDILGAAYTAGRVAWWRNDGPDAVGGITFSKIIIDSIFVGVDDISAVDLDGDGDQDVVGVSSLFDTVAWWRNEGPDGVGNIVFAKFTIDFAFDGAEDIRPTDFDGDGDIDILGVAHTADQVAWWRNDGGGTFTKLIIDSAFDGAEDISSADLDGDGDQDILAAAELAGAIAAWWRNDSDNTFIKQTVATDFRQVDDIHTADLDGDGDIDILGVAHYDDKVAWWRNDGACAGGIFVFTKFIIDAAFDGAEDIHSADLDGDGDIDVLVAAFIADDIVWWRNDGLDADGNIVFTKIINIINIANQAAVEVTGNAEPGSTVEVSLVDGATPLVTVTATGLANLAAGAFSITVDATTLADGQILITAKATDAAGNISLWSTPIIVTKDTMAPSASIDPVTSPTNVDTQTLTGAMEAGATITLSADTAATFTPVIYPTATTWRSDVTLIEGPNVITATATDAAGNVRTATDTTIVLDTIAPVITISLVITPTATTAQTLTGTMEAGTTVTMSSAQATTFGNVTTPTDTTWSVVATLVEGNNDITATATDAANNTGTASTTIVLDTAAPAITIDSVTTPTNVNTQTITGTMEAGTIVTMSSATATFGAITTPTDTAWSVVATLVEGTNNITATATDGAENQGIATATIELDTAAPAVAIASTAPNPTHVSPIPMTATFSEAVTGFIATDITVANGTVTAGSFAGTGDSYTFTVTPTVDGLVKVNIAAGAATDTADNPNTAAPTFNITFDSIAPVLSVTPDSLDFGEVIVERYHELDFTVTNAGGGILMGGATLPVGLFSIVGGSPFDIPAGQSATITVRFTPIVIGTVTDTVIFTSNAGDLNRSVSGVGVVPILYVTPVSLGFGSATIGEYSYLPFTVTNAGTGTLTGSAFLSSPPGPFSIVGDDSFSLEADLSTLIIVKFSPTEAVLTEGKITFNSDGGNLVRTVSGTGMTVGEPALSVTTAFLDFGSAAPGRDSKLDFIVTNTGEGTLTGNATLLLSPEPFSIISGSPFSLGADEEATITVRFSPTVTDTVTDTVTFTSNSGTLDRAVSGTGVAVNATALSVTPAFLDVGEVIIGQPRDFIFTVTNAGGGTLEGEAIVSAPFSIIGESSYSLGAGEIALITVRFSPTETGLVGEVVTFSGSCLNRSILGKGVPAPDPVRPPDDPICFIATAAFGTPLAEEVEVLSRLRDRYLLTNESGQRFVALYNRHSPALAEFISEREWARRAVCIALWPLVRIAELVIDWRK